LSGFEIREFHRLDFAQASLVGQGVTSLVYEIASPGNSVNHAASMTRRESECHSA